MPRKNMRKWEREQQIRGLFRVVGQGKLTAYDVARVLDVVPAKWLYVMLNNMVEDGTLTYLDMPHRSNATKRVYSWRTDV